MVRTLMVTCMAAAILPCVTAPTEPWAGEFLMGSTGSEAMDHEQPVTWVEISRGFWLAKYEVTQNYWQAVMGTNPSDFSDCGRCPVEPVCWNEAQAFIGRLNARAGGEPVPADDSGGVEVRSAAGNDRGPLLESRCDRVVRLQQRRSHAAGGPEDTECVGPARNAGKLVGVGAGPVPEPSRCPGERSPWFWVGDVPSVPGR